jgi:hypothetical protein
MCGVRKPKVLSHHPLNFLSLTYEQNSLVRFPSSSSSSCRSSAQHREAVRRSHAHASEGPPVFFMGNKGKKKSHYLEAKTGKKQY